jgi:hypothetical protein
VVSGSAKYPDPYDAAGTVRQAGYLTSIGRDSVVLGRPAAGRVNWINCEPDSFRGFVSEHATDLPYLRAAFNAALKAATVEQEAIRQEQQTARTLAATETAAADIKVETALHLLGQLSAEERQQFLDLARQRDLLP